MPSAGSFVYTPFDELDDRFTNAHRFGRPLRPELLLLRPNHKALLLLCPLLPPSPTKSDGEAGKSRRLRLPAEAWQRVLAFAMQAEDDAAQQRGPTDMGKVKFLLVCKSFQVSYRLCCHRIYIIDDVIDRIWPRPCCTHIPAYLLFVGLDYLPTLLPMLMPSGIRFDVFRIQHLVDGFNVFPYHDWPRAPPLRWIPTSFARFP